MDFDCDEISYWGGCIMTSFPVLIAVHEFIDWAQLIVLLMSIYYFIMFAVFQTDEEKKEDEERAKSFNKWLESEPWKKKEKKENKIKEHREEAKKKKEAVESQSEDKKEKAETKKEARESKEKRKKLDEHKHKVENLLDDLYDAMAAVKMAHEALPDNESDARKWVHRAKRSLARAKDSSALEDMAKDTSYKDHAKYLRSHVVGARTKLEGISLDESELKTFNGELGLTFDHIETLAKKIYGHLNIKRKATEGDKEKGKATGARRVGRVVPTR